MVDISNTCDIGLVTMYSNNVVVILVAVGVLEEVGSEVGR